MSSRRVTMAISDRVVYGLSQSDAAVSVNLWARELTTSLGVTLAIQRTCLMPSEELLAAIRARTIDAASLSIHEYRRVEQFLDSRRILSDGGSELLLIVSQTGGINDVTGLKGRRLLIHDNPHTILADAWLNVLLGAQRLGPPASVFSRIDRTTRAAQAVLPVFFDQADACIADRGTFSTMVELNPQLAKKLKVLQASPRMVSAFLVVRRDGPADLKDALFRKLAIATQAPTAKQVMTLFRSSNFSVLPGDVLQPSLAMIAEAERLNPTFRAGLR